MILGEKGILQAFVSQRLFDEELLRKKDTSFPRISIVMPSFNQAKFIERSILSVLNQNYPNLEYIIIDGGSTDGTVEIIGKYASYLDYWESQADRGQSHALNKGFSRATGEIMGWLNSDDLYLPGMLHLVADTFSSCSEALILFGDYLSIDESDEIVEIHYAFDFSLRHFIYEGFHNNAQATFWRREIQEKFGDFDESLSRTMDYDMLMRFGILADGLSIRRLPVPLACFRRHRGQKTGREDGSVLREHRAIASKLGLEKKFTGWGKLARMWYRARRAYWYAKRGGPRYLLGRLKRSFFSCE